MGFYYTFSIIYAPEKRYFKMSFKTFSQQLINESLLPFCDEDNESKIFYMKMKGDYYRYAAEVTEAEDRKS